LPLAAPFHVPIAPLAAIVMVRLDEVNVRRSDGFPAARSAAVTETTARCR